MKKKILFFICFLFIFIPFNIKAYCENDDLNNYSVLSNNINYYYDYYENNNYIYFNVVFYNLKDNFFIQNTSDKKFYDGEEEIKITNLKPGEEYVFNVYPKNSCSGKKVRIIHIKIPYYNKYYKYEICENLDDFEYCNKWSQVDLTYNELKEKVEQYTKEDIEIKETNEKYTIVDYIKKFLIEVYVEYYFVFLPLTIICLIMIIYYLDKKDRIL